MSQIPNITQGLNKFTPELYRRMADAIAVAEDSNFGDQLKGMRVWPSFWARITGFKIADAERRNKTVRSFLYTWAGGGFSSGEPDDEDFNPAVNLAEADLDEGTYLGVDIQQLELSSDFKVMPYCTSPNKIVNTDGDLDEGIDEYFTTGPDGAGVRIYVIGLFREIIDPTTGEPYPDETLAPTAATYAFTATPMLDGRCSGG